MAAGRWDHTAAVLAMLANINRDPKKQEAVKPRQFNPFRSGRQHGPDIGKDNFKLLKKVFVDRKP